MLKIMKNIFDLKKSPIFRAKSEDGFMGVMSTRDTYLGPGVQQTITISNMVVPARKEGAKVRFTLMATRYPKIHS